MPAVLLMFKALGDAKGRSKPAADKFHKDLKAELGQGGKGKQPPQEGLANPNFVGLLALLKQHGAGGAFGKHNVGEGDEVAFTAGEFSGKGCVTSAGEHGATVEDSTSREHRVHWHEITGHKPVKKPKAKDE